MRLHFSIGCYVYRRTSRLRQGIHFSITQVLYADHMHRRSRVNKFSFLRFQTLMQVGTNFPKVRRMLLCISPLVWEHFWPASTLLHGHLALATLFPPETGPSNYGALGLRWWGSPGQIIPSEGFWSRMSAWRATAFVNFTHRIGSRMSERSSVKSMKTSAAPYPGIRNPSVVYLMSRIQLVSPFHRIAHASSTWPLALLSPFFLDLLLGCSSTWRCA